MATPYSNPKQLLAPRENPDDTPTKANTDNGEKAVSYPTLITTDDGDKTSNYPALATIGNGEKTSNYPTPITTDDGEKTSRYPTPSPERSEDESGSSNDSGLFSPPSPNQSLLTWKVLDTTTNAATTTTASPAIKSTSMSPAIACKKLTFSIDSLLSRDPREVEENKNNGLRERSFQNRISDYPEVSCPKHVALIHNSNSEIPDDATNVNNEIKSIIQPSVNTCGEGRSLLCDVTQHNHLIGRIPISDPEGDSGHGSEDISGQGQSDETVINEPGIDVRGTSIKEVSQHHDRYTTPMSSDTRDSSNPPAPETSQTHTHSTHDGLRTGTGLGNYGDNEIGQNDGILIKQINYNESWNSLDGARDKDAENTIRHSEIGRQRREPSPRVQTHKAAVISCDDSSVANQNPSKDLGRDSSGESVKSSRGELSPSPASPNPHTHQKRKLKRTQYSKEAILQLNHHFTQNPWLSPEKQERLALDMGYTDTQIKTWFQNKRASIFGSRRPKKRPLQELSFNQPFSPHDLSRSQQPSQPLLHPGLQIPPPHQHHQQQQYSHNNYETKLQDRLRKDNTDIESSPHRRKMKTSPISSTMNENSTLPSFSPKYANSTAPNTSRLSYPTRVDPRAAGQVFPFIADEYLPHGDGNRKWTSPGSESAHKIPRIDSPTCFKSRLQISPSTSGDPTETTPPMASMNTSSFPPYFRPVPYTNPSSVWTRPFFSHFNRGIDPRPVVHGYRTHAIPNMEYSYNPLPVMMSGTGLHETSRHHSGFVSPPTGLFALGKPGDIEPHLFHNHAINAQPLQPQTPNLHAKLPGLHPELSSFHNQSPDLLGHPVPFSSFLEEFAKRLRTTASKGGNYDKIKPANFQYPDLSVCSHEAGDDFVKVD